MEDDVGAGDIRVDGLAVADVELDESRPSGREREREILGDAANEGVESHDLARPCGNGSIDDVRSDVPRAAGDDDARAREKTHVHHSLCGHDRICEATGGSAACEVFVGGSAAHEVLASSAMDWSALFEPHHVAENVIRASAIFLLLFVLLRVLPNRKTGSLGPADLLVLVLLATVVNGALNRDVSSLTDAVVMVATIVAWGFIIDLLGAHVPFVRRLLHSEPVEVIRDGEILVRNLRREFMTEDELRAQLRLQGVESEREVAHAYVEHDGRMSVIRKDGPGPQPRQDKAGLYR